MQTGLQSLKQADGSFASYYFGDDGVMRTGKQTIYNDDLEEKPDLVFPRPKVPSKDRATMESAITRFM